MTLAAFSLLLASLTAFVVGQLFLKVAMSTDEADGRVRRRFSIWLPAGIAALTIYFFLTLGLLQRYDLSYLFPFQGATVLFLAGASYFILKEKFTLQLTIGVVLITLGVALVSTT